MQLDQVKNELKNLGFKFIEESGTNFNKKIFDYREKIQKEQKEKIEQEFDF